MWLFQKLTRDFLIRLALFSVTVTIISIVCALWIPVAHGGWAMSLAVAASTIWWGYLWRRDKPR